MICFLPIGYHLNQHLQELVNLEQFSAIGNFGQFVEWLKEDAFPNIFPTEDLSGEKLNAGDESLIIM